MNLFAEGSEDCLYLNVYTKESPASEIWRSKIINIKIILLNIFKLKNGKKNSSHLLKIVLIEKFRPISVKYLKISKVLR